MRCKKYCSSKVIKMLYKDKYYIIDIYIIRKIFDEIIMKRK